MRAVELALPGVWLLEPERFEDHRGVFAVTYERAALAELGLIDEFVQDNLSRSSARGTVRGLHLQVAPSASAKLVRVARGAVLDVVVDVRHGSATYGRHVATELSAESWRQIYVPRGFAHGFSTLVPECEVVYKVSAAYAPAAERGVRWNDPALGIAWPVAPADAILSERDRSWPLLAELEPVLL